LLFIDGVSTGRASPTRDIAEANEMIETKYQGSGGQECEFPQPTEGKKYKNTDSRHANNYYAKKIEASAFAVESSFKRTATVRALGCLSHRRGAHVLEPYVWLEVPPSVEADAKRNAQLHDGNLPQR
jgi:hypothetical protein